MLSRFLITAGLAAFGAMVAANGLDRVSRESPGVERVVPTAFRAQANRSAAAINIVRENSEQALAAARAAVSHDPVDPDSAAELGSALLLGQQDDAAAAAFRVAAHFGWRNTATQLYWFQAAIQAGDIRVAADRADAILRTHPGFAERDDLLQPLETDPAARKVLIGHLAQRPYWLNSYLLLPSDLDDAVVTRRVLTLSEMGTASPPLGCNVVGNTVRALLDRNRRNDAEAVWNANCPEMRIQGLLADPQFASVDTEGTFPFGWQVARSGDVAIRHGVAGKDTHTLVITNSAPVASLVLYQPVAFPPGTYRLHLAIVGDKTAASGRLSFAFACNKASVLRSPAVGDPVLDGQTIVVGQCQREQLGLWLTDGSAPVEIQSIQLEKVG